MNTKSHFFSILFVMAISCTFGQRSEKIASYFENPIIVDSASTIIIPTRYNSEFLSTNKMAYWGDFYANIIFYNFITDSSKKLFDNNTFIYNLNPPYYSYRLEIGQNKYRSSRYLFYRVKNVDRNKSGRIDEKDPTILYISDRYGNNLQSLTSENENVVGLDIFEKGNFVLVKIQRDSDNDGDFELEDKDFYFVKLDLGTLKFGKKIETK